ncbi:MAG: histidine kinase N-terminal 7TM domain-containing protein [Acetatifactor sp.]
MTFQILVSIQCISILLLMVEALYIFFRWRTRLHSFLFLNCVATLINNLGYLMTMTAHTSGEALMAAKFSYFGKVWIPFSLLVFVMELCKIKVDKRFYTGLALVHTVIFFLVLTCEFHNLYYSDFYFTEEGLFPHNVYGHGIVYNIYANIVLIYIIVGLAFLVITTWRERRVVERKRLCYILAAIAVESLSYLIYLTGVTMGYDLTVIGYTVSTVFMYVALFKYDLMDTLELVRDYVSDNLSEGIIALDELGRVIYVNDYARHIYPAIEKTTQEVFDEIEYSIKEKLPLEKGAKMYLAEKAPLYQKETLRGTVYILVDDTEHYHYTRELKEQKELAEAANASKSAFLSIVSHEIRTPMNAVVGMTELLLRDKENLSSKQEKYLSNIKNSGAALVMIVNDILDMSKIEAGKVEIVEQPYELRPMVADVRMIIENRIGSKPIHLVMEIDDAIPQFLVGDSLRIRQILINLMNNAVKFTEDGYIQLSIKCVQEQKDKRLLRFAVKDSGQGIKTEDLSRLGEAFTQVDVKKNHSKEGTGLGLSISRDFISLMGGQLEVTSEYGKGSEFYFTISQGVAAGIDVTTGSGVGKQAWQEEEQFEAPDARVLIVDDTEINLMITEELLSPLGMSIDTANSGEKALELVKKNRYDVIFMDYMMPYMDGVQTTEKIRGFALEYGATGKEAEAEYFKSVPIITLSGDNSEATRERFMRAGIDDFTEKPVELKRLKKLLLKWLPKEKIRG